MKPLLISLLLFVPFALGARYYFVCHTLQWCDLVSLSGRATQDLPLVLPNGRTTHLSHGSYPPGALSPPRSSQQLATYDSLASFLNAYPDHVLLVDAPVHAQESDDANGYYRDLGVARAAELAGELQRRGVAGERLELRSYNVTADQPVALRLKLIASVPEFAVDALPSADVLLDSTALLGLRFETNSTALSPSTEFVAYAEELVNTLNAAPQLSLKLIGHTDNRDEENFNDTLGLLRAQAVAGYLTQIGYTRPITVETRGEREPIAANATPEGRYLNRRVEVRID